MATKLIRSFLLTLFVVTIGCSEVFTAPFAYGAVEVQVTLPEGGGVPNLDLTLYSGTRHLAYLATDSIGFARFAFVPEGPLGVSIRPSPIFRPASHPDGYYQTFTMSEGQVVRLTFEFVDTRGAIQVRIQSGSGVPLSGQTVELYNAREALTQADTDALGGALFDRLAEGDYGVRVVASPTCVIPPEGAYRDGLVIDSGNRLDVLIVLENC